MIVTNTIGMFHFLWTDIDMLNEMGYKVYAMADNRAGEEHTLRMMVDRNVTFVDTRIDGVSLTKNTRDFYKQLRRLLASHHFDLVHCHTPLVGLFVRICLSLEKVDSQSQ